MSHLDAKLIDERPSDLLSPRRSTRHDLITLGFYKKENWFDEFCEVLFKVKERESSISNEVYCGLIHFISCSYVLAVVPQQLFNAGYSSKPTVVTVAAVCGVGSIIGGLFTNLPFVIAPPTVISIFLSVFLQSHGLSSVEGNAAVIISGFCLMAFFWRPLGRLAGKLIPLPIQVGTTLGVGLLTALAGATEINLVDKGEYTILAPGDLTSQSALICLTGILIIGTAIYYKIKGAFCIALVFCSLTYWAVANEWPNSIVSAPKSNYFKFDGFDHQDVGTLTIDLLFLYILYLSGLIATFTDLAHLKRTDGSTPRSRWFFIIAGLMTLCSGFLTSAPVLISPESSAAIKAGAKTGLSTLVCGVLFCISVFFAPLFESVPGAGTSPLLLMIGVILFQDVNRINWRDVTDAFPAFMVLFFIPFTYSVIHGVIIGYIVYLVMGSTTGLIIPRSLRLLAFYYPSGAIYLNDRFNLQDEVIESLRQCPSNRHSVDDPNHRGMEHAARGLIIDEGVSTSVSSIPISNAHPSPEWGSGIC